MSNVNAEFWNSIQLEDMGITCGKGCLVHKTNTIINPNKLTLGDNVRIDGFCVLSCAGEINIESNVHIASHVILMGGAGIRIKKNASIASGSKVLSMSDDVMGRGIIGPCVDEEYRYVHKGMVTLEEHSVMSINSVAMPNSTLTKGSTLLPFSILMKNDLLPDYVVLGGVPAVVVKGKQDNWNLLIKKYEDETT